MFGVCVYRTKMPVKTPSQQILSTLKAKAPTPLGKRTPISALVTTLKPHEFKQTFPPMLKDRIQIKSTKSDIS